MDTSYDLELAMGCGYTTSTQWFNFNVNIMSGRSVIMLYDKHLNYLWGRAYDKPSNLNQVPFSINKCYFSASNNYIVSSTWTDWVSGHDAIMINRVSDGSVV